MRRRFWIASSCLLHLSILAAAAFILFVGPPQRENVVQVELVTERLGPGAREPHGVNPSTLMKQPRERLLQVHRLTREDLDAIALVPDPLALRTRIEQLAPDRVLEPSNVQLFALRRPRLGRPLLLRFQVENAVPGDAFVLVDSEGAHKQVQGRYRNGLWVSELEVPPLREKESEIGLRWSGRRKGRYGLVEIHFEIAAGVAPGYWLGPGVSAKSAWLSALEVQGFKQLLRREDADFLVLDLGSKAVADLSRDLDRGLGCLLLASPGKFMHPTYRAIAPVVPLAPRSENPLLSRSQQVGTSGKDSVVPRAPGRSPKAAAADESQGAAIRKKAQAEELRHAVREEQLRTGRSKERRKESAAVVILLDNSGSMAGPSELPRIKEAKAGARLAASLLGDDDQFALITFGDRTVVWLPIGKAQRRKELNDVLEKIRATGATTRAFPGLEAAWRELKKSHAKLRHIILLTDGGFHDQNSKRSDYMKVVVQMRKEGIRLDGFGILEGVGFDSSLQAVGEYQFLKRLIKTNGGSFEYIHHASNIAKKLVRQVEVVTELRLFAAREPESKSPSDKAGGKAEAKPAESEDSPSSLAKGLPSGLADKPRHELIVVEAGPVLSGLEDKTWPRVAQFLPLEAKLRARVHLAVGSEGFCYLATAAHGLGRVAVFAGVGKSAGGLAAEAWFPRLVGQCAAWLARPGQGEGQGGRTSREALLASKTARVKILAGEGLAAGTLSTIAERISAELGSSADLPLAAQSRQTQGPVLPWLMALFGASFILLLLERVIRRSWLRD